MSVEVLTNFLPEKAQKYCRMLNYFILTVFFAIPHSSRFLAVLRQQRKKLPRNP